GAKLLAGGTDLLPQMKNGLLKPAWVVDLSRVAELHTLAVEGGELHIGAAVTARALELDQRVRGRYASIAESGALVGSVQVRNLATVGGNLCNAAPSADMAPPLIALDAMAVIAGPKGRRRVPLGEFFTGVRRTLPGADELLVQLVLPDPGARRGPNSPHPPPRRALDGGGGGAPAGPPRGAAKTGARPRRGGAGGARAGGRAPAGGRARRAGAVPPELTGRAAGPPGGAPKP